MHDIAGLRVYVRLISRLVLCLAIASCATGSTRNATSIVDYLYPNTRDPVVSPSIPVLTLPTRVGIAFVPGGVRGQQSGLRGVGTLRGTQGFTLTEAKKIAVMQEVANHFKKYPFVKDIELIPSAYLTSQGSFANLDQVRTMHNVNVIALLSFDQTQFTDEGVLSLAYWTIVGAYVVQGQRNDTHTMLDAVVYDIPSRKMLFRAPGTSHIKGSATLVNLSEQLRKDSETGFNEATKQMIGNLDQQLVAFRDRIKERPGEVKVVRTEEYRSRGGGALDGFLVTMLIVLCAGFVWTQRRG
jgi:rhombotail lipoprotein